MRKFGLFKNKTDGHRAAKKHHYCLECRYNQPEKYTECPNCGSRNRVYFPSDTEMRRGAMLLTLQAAGEITDLEFHPRYDIVVNGKKICTYIADARYTKAGFDVVEDSKAVNTKFIDPVSKLKIALFEALYCQKVVIPQRQAGKSKNTATEAVLHQDSLLDRL